MNIIERAITAVKQAIASAIQRLRDYLNNLTKMQKCAIVIGVLILVPFYTFEIGIFTVFGASQATYDICWVWWNFARPVTNVIALTLIASIFTS